MESILVLNCGSSSVKFALFALENTGLSQQAAFCQGIASHLNESEQGSLTCETAEQRQTINFADNHHKGAITAIFAYLDHLQLLKGIHAVGHRVVHGGDAFRAPVHIDEHVEATIKRVNAFAPLHNPANLLGIQLCRQLMPAIPQVAVFDTAFHGTLPPVAYHYAVPAEWQQKWGVRRYGFHGISHHYIATCLPRLLQLPANEVRAVSTHLGNGCSICAIKGQHSVDTSMGFTPLEGLVMGSRSGDLDPGLHEYLCDKLGVNIKTLTAILNREAGLKGLSGVSNDMRECLQAADTGNEQAQLAVELFCYRLAKYIAACVVPLGEVGTIVFTGGIGENAAPIRANVIQLLSGLGYRLDHHANAQASHQPRNIAQPDSPAILVIPTREEWLIAQQAATLLITPQTSTGSNS